MSYYLDDAEKYHEDSGSPVPATQPVAAPRRATQPVAAPRRATQQATQPVSSPPPSPSPSASVPPPPPVPRLLSQKAAKNLQETVRLVETVNRGKSTFFLDAVKDTAARAARKVNLDPERYAKGISLTKEEDSKYKSDSSEKLEESKKKYEEQKKKKYKFQVHLPPPPLAGSNQGGILPPPALRSANAYNMLLVYHYIIAKQDIEKLEKNVDKKPEAELKKDKDYFYTKLRIQNLNLVISDAPLNIKAATKVFIDSNLKHHFGDDLFKEDKDKEKDEMIRATRYGENIIPGTDVYKPGRAEMTMKSKVVRNHYFGQTHNNFKAFKVPISWIGKDKKRYTGFYIFKIRTVIFRNSKKILKRGHYLYISDFNVGRNFKLILGLPGDTGFAVYKGHEGENIK